MKKLSTDEMKKIIGGDSEVNRCGRKGEAGCCNVYCGQGSGVQCEGTCGICDAAGNGQNPNVPGGDRLCVQFV